jgi:hypothetical protein
MLEKLTIVILIWISLGVLSLSIYVLHWLNVKGNERKRKTNYVSLSIKNFFYTDRISTKMLIGFYVFFQCFVFGTLFNAVKIMELTPIPACSKEDYLLGRNSICLHVLSLIFVKTSLMYQYYNT